MRLPTGVLCVLLAVVATGAWSPTVPRAATAPDSASVAGRDTGPSADVRFPGGSPEPAVSSPSGRPFALAQEPVAAQARAPGESRASREAPERSSDDTAVIVIGLAVVALACLTTMAVAVVRTSGHRPSRTVPPERAPPATPPELASRAPEPARAPEPRTSHREARRRWRWAGRRRPGGEPEPGGDPADARDDPGRVGAWDAPAGRSVDDPVSPPWEDADSPPWDGPDSLTWEDDLPPADAPTLAVRGEGAPARPPAVRATAPAPAARGRGTGRRARVRTPLHPEGYVELDECLRRAEWAAGDTAPPAVGALVEVVDQDAGALRAYPLRRGPHDHRPST